MSIGPVQLIVLGFEHPEFHGEIIEELERLRESDTVRVIDALAVHKDADGEIEVAHLSNLSRDEAVEMGSTIGALIGLGIEGEEGLEEGAIAGAQAAADGISAFDEEEAWDIIEEIPNDPPPRLPLISPPWGGPPLNAIARAGGFSFSPPPFSPPPPLWGWGGSPPGGPPGPPSPQTRGAAAGPRPPPPPRRPPR